MTNKFHMAVVKIWPTQFSDLFVVFSQCLQIEVCDNLVVSNMWLSKDCRGMLGVVIWQQLESYRLEATDLRRLKKFLPKFFSFFNLNTKIPIPSGGNHFWAINTFIMAACSFARNIRNHRGKLETKKLCASESVCRSQLYSHKYWFFTWLQTLRVDEKFIIRSIHYAITAIKIWTLQTLHTLAQSGGMKELQIWHTTHQQTQIILIALSCITDALQWQDWMCVFASYWNIA